MRRQSLAVRTGEKGKVAAVNDNRGERCGDRRGGGTFSGERSGGGNWG